MAENGSLPAVTLAQIRQAARGEQRLDVPEWGGSVLLRSLTRGEIRAMGSMDAAAAEAHALACACLEPAFTIEEAAEVLEGQAFGPTQRILAAILDLSGVRDFFRT